MRVRLEIGQAAPNFDLASTEDVVLMLRDEVPRTPVLLFFFGEVESALTELRALGEISRELTRLGIKVMAISAAKLEELKSVQKELGLSFPLLHDDRNLSRAYCAASAASENEAATSASVFVLVGKDQKVLWIGQAPLAADAIRSAAAAAQKVSSTVNYPRKVINRLVDRWVN
jgi:peroxiredoxin